MAGLDALTTGTFNGISDARTCSIRAWHAGAFTYKPLCSRRYCRAVNLMQDHLIVAPPP
jgi:hypothetical protein